MMFCYSIILRNCFAAGTNGFCNISRRSCLAQSSSLWLSRWPGTRAQQLIDKAWTAFGLAQQVGCLKGREFYLKYGTQASGHYTERVINCSINDADVDTATPDRYTVFCCRIYKGQGSLLKNSCTGIPSQSSNLPYEDYL